MNILGYPVIGQVKTPTGTYPLVDIPMMSDERYQELAAEQAIKHFTKEHGYAPESTQQAFEWQRGWVAQMIQDN